MVSAWLKCTFIEKLFLVKGQVVNLLGNTIVHNLMTFAQLHQRVPGS